MVGSIYYPTYIGSGYKYHILYKPENYKKELSVLKQTLESLSTEDGTIQYIETRPKTLELVTDDNGFIDFLKDKLGKSIRRSKYVSDKFTNSEKRTNYFDRKMKGVKDENAAFFIISSYADTYKSRGQVLSYGEFPTKENTISPFLVKFYKEYKTPGLNSDVSKIKEKVETLHKQVSEHKPSGGSKRRRKSRKPTRKPRRTSHRRKTSRKHSSSP